MTRKQLLPALIPPAMVAAGFGWLGYLMLCAEIARHYLGKYEGWKGIPIGAAVAALVYCAVVGVLWLRAGPEDNRP